MLFQQNYLESNFIQKYGSESLKYECVDKLGDTSFKLNLHIISGVILFIVFTLCLGLSQPKKEKTTLKTKPRTNFQIVLLIVGIFCFIGSMVNAGIFGYLFISCYLPQKEKWFNGLPDDGKNLIAQIEINQQTQDRLDRIESNQNTIKSNQNTIKLNIDKQ